MSRRGIRIPIVGRRIPKVGLVLLAMAALVILAVTISSRYPSRYFNPHGISFIVLAFWCGWALSVLWDDLQGQSHRGFRIFRFLFMLTLSCTGLVAIGLKNPHLRGFYFLTILILLALRLLWKRYRRKIEQEQGMKSR